MFNFSRNSTFLWLRDGEYNGQISRSHYACMAFRPVGYYKIVDTIELVHHGTVFFTKAPVDFSTHLNIVYKVVNI